MIPMEAKSTQQFTEDLNANFNELKEQANDNSNGLAKVEKDLYNPDEGLIATDIKIIKSALETKQKKILFGSEPPSNDMGEENDIYFQYI